MAKSKTVYVYGKGTAEYARLKEDNRDTGANLDPGEQKDKIEQVDGYYLMNLLVSEEEQDRMIEAGIPDSGMAGQLWKKDKATKQRFYKCKRQHFNPSFVNEEKEQDGILGPPKVYLLTEGSVDIDETTGKPVFSDSYKREEFDGLIGNGSEVICQFSVWDQKKVELISVIITDLVEYEQENDRGGF